jgi:hypothetical protein
VGLLLTGCAAEVADPTPTHSARGSVYGQPYDVVYGNHRPCDMQAAVYDAQGTMTLVPVFCSSTPTSIDTGDPDPFDRSAVRLAPDEGRPFVVATPQRNER